MKRLLPAIALVALSLGGTATAQSYPGDRGLGNKLGLQQLNNSGQIGTVTLFDHGAATSIVIVVDGTRGRPQSASIHRGSDCDAVDPTPVYKLDDLKNGRGHTIVNVSNARLTSGNYSVLVYAGTQAAARPVACGHLIGGS